MIVKVLEAGIVDVCGRLVGAVVWVGPLVLVIWPSRRTSTLPAGEVILVRTSESRKIAVETFLTVPSSRNRSELSPAVTVSLHLLT